MTKVRKRNSIIIGAVALIALILIAFFAVNAKAETEEYAYFHAQGGYFVDAEGNKTDTNAILIEYGPGYPIHEPIEPQSPDETKSFMGWYKSPDYEGECMTLGDVMDDRTPGDRHYYAKWGELITITYDFNGGKSWDGQDTIVDTVEKGEELYVWADYGESPKPNQVMCGWYENKTFDGISVAEKYVSFDEDITLYAKWADAWKVTIDMGEGSDGSEYSWLIEKGTSERLYINRLSKNPLDNGKMFAGVYTGPNGTGEAVLVYTKTEPEEWMSSTPEWYVDGFDFKPTKDTTLYAFWTEPITVTYDANGGTLRFADDQKSVAKKTLPGHQPGDYSPFPEREGYTFLGWATDKDGKNRVKSDESLKENTTLYAAWGEGYKVTCDANGGTFGGKTKNVVTFGKDASIDELPYIEEPWKDGMVFAGWYYDKECKNEIENIYTFYPEKDMTLYAGWSKAAKLTYNANGGSFYGGEEDTRKETTEVYIAKGRTPTLFRPDFYPTGKEFEGWYLDKQFKQKVDSSTAITEDTVIYAHWVDPVTLTFDANGGSFPWDDGASTRKVTTIPSEPIDYNDYEYYLIEREGYVFNGWYLEKEGKTPFNPRKEDVKLTENVTIYAKWTKGYPVISINYYVNHAKVAEADATVNEENQIEDRFVHFLVDSWDLEREGVDPTKQGVSTEWYLDKQMTQPFKNTSTDVSPVNVYGKLVDRCKVTFHAKDASLYSYYMTRDGDNFVFVNKGTPLSKVLNDLEVYREKPGAIHKGWSLDSEGKQLPSATMVVNESLDLYEVTDKAYTVTFDANGATWDTGKWGGLTTYIDVLPGKALNEGVPEYGPMDADRIQSGDSLYHYADKLFKGWYEDKAFTKKVEKLADYKPSSDITLYAKWERYGEETPPTPDKPVTPDEPAKPDEPSNPDDTKPTPAPAVKNGVVKGDDGKWALYKDDKVNTSYTGIAKNEYGWWRIVEGYVDFNATGIYKNEFGWWRVEDGKVDFEADGIYRNEYGWWKTTDGKVTFDETGVFKNEYGWWRVEDSKVDFSADGIYKNEYGWWKTTDGKVTFVEDGVFKNEYGWWKVDDSKVDFKFTGIAKNKYGTWYVKNGKVDFNKNGKVKFEGKTYTVKNGKVQ